MTDSVLLTESLLDETLTNVRQAFAVQCSKLGVSQQGFDADFAETEERTDPFDNSSTLFGFWRSSLGMLLGTVQVHESGRVYAEYDLTMMHPEKKGWFIEAVTVWGTGSDLKSELRMIPAPGS